MNHYERLKVSQDAPPEVIRAAYRALAGKLHPDRQGSETGPDDEMHNLMVALNGAYEVLIDPKLRQDYDASLAPSRPLFGATSSIPQEAAHPGAGSARVDMDWLVPQAAPPKSPWPPSPRTMLIGGSVGGLVVLAGAAWIWQVLGQHQIEQALSDQYASHPPSASAPVGDMPPLPPLPSSRMAALERREVNPEVARAAEAALAATERGARRPTVAELSRMSDEELLNALPTLDADPAARPSSKSLERKTAALAHHPLDGKPLSLRTDATLVDPLAPESAQPRR